MWPFTAGETVLLITTVFTGLMGLITTWRTQRIQEVTAATKAQVDVVHDATNSRLSLIDKELQRTRQQLELAVAQLNANEQTRAVLAAETAGREGAPANVPPLDSRR